MNYILEDLIHVSATKFWFFLCEVMDKSLGADLCQEIVYHMGSP